MKSSIAIDVAAPPGVVFGLARDVERWTQLLPHYRRSRRVRATADGDGALLVQFIALRPIGPAGVYGVPVAWRARTWADPAACRLRFLHVGGATAGMDVTWRIEPRRAGCRITIEHDFRAPGWWAEFVDRFFTRPIAGRTLATFRALAEATAESAESAGALVTKTTS